MSQAVAVHLKPSDLGIILVALSEVRITDAHEAQVELYDRLKKSLKRADPGGYQALLENDVIPVSLK